MQVESKKVKSGLKGVIEIPPDKSISHRAVLFSALTKGEMRVNNFSKGVDCLSSLDIIEKLGCEAKFLDEKTLFINAKNAMKKPDGVLDCGNSGTTMRLMSGILAAQSFSSILIGDKSLSKRPMKRVIEPLSLMGAQIQHNEFKAPLEIQGGNLVGIEYDSNLSSAQVKSAVLLAGLFAEGETVYKETSLSRNHTELMLEYMGAEIKPFGTSVSIKQSTLNPCEITIPGDISSAAFFMAAATIVPNSSLIIKNVGINPTRTGIIDVLCDMGGDIEILNERFYGKEPVADLKINYAELKGTTISGDLIPRLIDELPVIAVIASQAEGRTIVSGAEDLRNKESDRISSLAKELRKIGIEIEETPDGFIIESKGGKQKLKGNTTLECYHDHRLAMSFYIAGMISENPIIINEFEWVNISFPEFLSLAEKITL